jgi:hypothetical protein
VKVVALGFNQVSASHKFVYLRLTNLNCYATQPLSLALSSDAHPLGAGANLRWHFARYFSHLTSLNILSA